MIETSRAGGSWLCLFQSLVHFGVLQNVDFKLEQGGKIILVNRINQIPSTTVIKLQRDKEWKILG